MKTPIKAGLAIFPFGLIFVIIGFGILFLLKDSVVSSEVSGILFMAVGVFFWLVGFVTIIIGLLLRSSDDDAPSIDITPRKVPSIYKITERSVVYDDDSEIFFKNEPCLCGAEVIIFNRDRKGGHCAKCGGTVIVEKTAESDKGYSMQDRLDALETIAEFEMLRGSF